MELWQLALGVGGFLTPIALAALARDRSLMTMMTSVQTAVADQIKSATDPIHERVNRIRDEFVRRDDLDGHLARWDKRFDEMRADMQRNNDEMKKTLKEITTMLRER